MDNISLFKAIEGKNITVCCATKHESFSLEFSHIKISLDGELMSGNHSIAINWGESKITNVGNGEYVIFTPDMEIDICVADV